MNLILAMVIKIQFLPKKNQKTISNNISCKNYNIILKESKLILKHWLEEIPNLYKWANQIKIKMNYRRMI